MTALRQILPLLLTLAACEHSFGLTAANDPATAGDGQSGLIGAPVEGLTWSVNLQAMTLVGPAGFETIMERADSSAWLFHASEQTQASFDITGVASTSTGEQDPCRRPLTLNRAKWTDATMFTVDGGKLTVGVTSPQGTNRTVEFVDIFLDVTADTSDEAVPWSSGTLTALVDTRQLKGAAFPDGLDVCTEWAADGLICEACTDATLNCVTLEYELTASKGPAGFDVDAGSCR